MTCAGSTHPFFWRELFTKHGRTPLIIACYHGLVEVVAMLLEHKANIEATDKVRKVTARCIVLNNCSGDVFGEACLTFFANVVLLTKFGWTPLMSSCNDGHTLDIKVCFGSPLGCGLFDPTVKQFLFVGLN
jgi:ankyrin repeat protein